MGQSSSSSSSLDETPIGAQVSDARRLSIHDPRLTWRATKLVDSLASAQNAPVYRVDLTNITHDDAGISVADALKIIYREYRDVQTLILRFNNLTQCPTLDEPLPQLRVFSLENNSIQDLKLDIDRLLLLEEINIGSNPLQSFPAEIEKMVHLQVLKCANTMVKTVPDWVGSLKSLRKIDLFNAQLVRLPEALCQLSGLTHLDLGNNYLTDLPTTFPKLHNLEWLSLNKNTWRSDSLFPEGSAVGLSNLRSLFMSGCHLSEIPSQVYEMASLTQLDLSDNKLAKLSIHLLNLTSLTKLNLNKNVPIEEQAHFKDFYEQLRLHIVEEREGVLVWKSKLEETAIPAYDSDIAPKFTHPDKYHHVSLAAPWGASTYSMNELVDKIRGLVFGAALADAVGLATEFLTREEALFYYGGHSKTEQLTPNNFIRDRHRRAFVPFDWTDDTDQMITLMNYLTDCDGNITPQGFAERLLHWSQHGFADLGDSVGQGIGSTTLSILSHPNFTADPYKVAKDVWDQSGKTKAPNGALMRCAILGVPLFYDFSTVIRQTRIASMVTHVDPRSTASCVTVTTIIANMLRGNCRDNRSMLESLEKVLDTARKEMTDATRSDQEFIRSFNATTFEELQLNTNIGYVLKTLGCALAGLRMSTLPNHNSLSDAFKSIISKLVMFGGDADTNATVVGALLGCHWGFSNLPKDWIDSLVFRHWLLDQTEKFIDKLKLEDQTTSSPRPK
eukprot:TRINITY_DN455_c0_g1_i1.p1 TRINITY_DN455_c0_g1~~TRINITY_DN455_c0_g1_i1.p1  ORF type:complete len:729 (-),score=90.84 TRINITY_DN455_c0_g1_i1:60-2246(-)